MSRRENKAPREDVLHPRHLWEFWRNGLDSTRSLLLHRSAVVSNRIPVHGEGCVIIGFDRLSAKKRMAQNRQDRGTLLECRRGSPSRTPKRTTRKERGENHIIATLTRLCMTQEPGLVSTSGSPERRKSGQNVFVTIYWRGKRGTTPVSQHY